MLKAKLVVVGGDAKRTEVNLKALPCVIGRAKEATLTLPHPLVSRRHTELFEKDGQLWVRDLGSLNGTFLNNQRLEAAQPLPPNQLLTLGNVTFRAVYELEEVQLTDKMPGETIKEDLHLSDTPADELPEIAEAAAGSGLSGLDAGGLSALDQLTTQPMPAPVRRLPVDTQAAPESPAPVVPPVATKADQKAASNSAAEKHADVNKPLQMTAAGPSQNAGVVDLDSDYRKASDSSDTNKSLVPGDGESRIEIELDETTPVDKSISLSSLEGLRSLEGAEPTAAASFAGGISDEEVASKPESVIEAVKLDLGDDGPNSDEDDNDTGIESFIRKLPR